ncbi:hypothetical protein [Oceanihabitans sediminis]|uniref:PAP2 family protein n=1 Tax=Oceanihabitans sediminis TaxID=1812012 RepID=A0A368P6N9_9FLAO|nr:hypothetical protein [Oceanihabitans sediminis]MDX1277796.1 hypothetical protein [Oceanihabitans sediminis]MDX1772748.1 hypothetical protein [Oceanihabitans sediminis]RBP34419.1 hypothetical protein DFR65_101311 [Oceanihabitans sediminis]RCU58093.1 hypothetical protein DU428_01535 [Oceanihabitans sediminis]
MINFLLKSISYILHPLIMPLCGLVFYFAKSPRYIPIEIIEAKLISITILTLILPILIYYLLKTLGKAESVDLKTTKERVLPLGLNCIIIYLILKRVFPSNQMIELYYFFIGVLLSNLACLILAIFQFKASIHMIGISGLFMFFIAFSINFGININGTLSLMAIFTGAIASSRLHLKAHTYKELLVGFCVGFVPQLMVMFYW